jgi:hypothetical protein
VTGVWRSTDGGEFVASRPIAAGDGSLILADTRRTLVSDDEGRTFRREGGASGWVAWTRGGYLRTQGGTFALSGDGLHWRQFTVG